MCWGRPPGKINCRLNDNMRNPATRAFQVVPSKSLSRLAKTLVQVVRSKNEAPEPRCRKPVFWSWIGWGVQRFTPLLPTPPFHHSFSRLVSLAIIPKNPAAALPMFAVLVSPITPDIDDHHKNPPNKCVQSTENWPTTANIAALKGNFPSAISLTTEKGR